MNPNGEYQAITMGPEERAFKPETQSRSRFRSLTDLTPPKAIVLATTIVCITFATIHFNGHALTQKAHEQAYGPLLSRSEGFSVAQDSSNESNPFCYLFKDRPEMCYGSPFIYEKCLPCDWFHQRVQPVAAPPTSIQKASLGQKVRNMAFGALPCQDLEAFGLCFHPSFHQFCMQCNISPY